MISSARSWILTAVVAGVLLPGPARAQFSLGQQRAGTSSATFLKIGIGARANCQRFQFHKDEPRICRTSLCVQQHPDESESGGASPLERRYDATGLFQGDCAGSEVSQAKPDY